MKIVKGFPPNFSDIKRAVNPPKDAVFPYGAVIYNPSGEIIPPDVQYHEQIHINQQKAFVSPELWWQKWCLDINFRKEQEVKAFAGQLDFIKRFYPNKAVKEALYEMAENLSKNYKLGITISQAETLIRLDEKAAREKTE